MRWTVLVHRWLGLALGAWFAFAGLTGALLVFWKPIEALEYRAPSLTPGAALPLEALVSAAKARHPTADAFRLFLPEPAGGAAQVEMLLAEGRRVSLHLDPTSGAVLSERSWGGAIIHWIYDVHSGGVFGRAGVATVGLLGIALALLVVLGVGLWLRYAWRPLRESLWPRGGLRGLRRLRNLHRPTGLWLALPLALAGATGFGLAYPEVVRAVMPALLGPGTAPGPVAAPGRGERVGLAAAAAAAEAALPGWRAVWIELPAKGARQNAVIRLRSAEPGRVDGIAQVFVSLDSGAVKPVAPSPVERFRAWIMALHNGAAFGLAHQLAVVALGLAPALLAATGFLAWRRRRSAPRRESQGQRHGPAPGAPSKRQPLAPG